MATLFLMCGLPCAGKTTAAKRLERERPALRFTPDEWLHDLIGADRPTDAMRDAVERLQGDLAMRALDLGIDVVLDHGFWSRAVRDEYRARAAAHGADAHLVFLDVEREELLRRVRARNATLSSGTYHVAEHEIDLWSAHFERPDDDERAAGTPPRA